MTQDELMVLERGRIPALPIIQAVKRYVRENGNELRAEQLDLICVGDVAERAGVPLTTLVTWVEQPDRAGAMPFNVADRLLCASEQWILWYGELSEYYMRVNLNVRECAHPDCKVEFEVKPPLLVCTVEGCTEDHYSRGMCHKHEAKARYHARKESERTGRTCAEIMDERHPKVSNGRGVDPLRREYCSRECAMSGKKGNRRHKKMSVPRGTQTPVCRNGHKRTPENTIVLGSGKVRCRQCNRDASARAYKVSRELAA